MKRKTKVLIIAGACLLVVGVGTGITVHNVKVNTSTMERDMSVSESTAVREGKTNKTDADGTNGASEEAENSDSEKVSSETGRVVANESKNSTESGKTSTEGRTTASERRNTTENRTEGRTEGRTTESRTEARTETTTEGKRVEPTTETPNTEHTHNWVAVYKTVHHDATYKEEKYVVKEAWDEEVTKSGYICNGCGKFFDGALVNEGCDKYFDGVGLDDPAVQVYYDFSTHISSCQGGSSYHTDRVVINTIHHPEEYGTRKVVDREAWDEQVVDYYKCQCGATKK